jgi:hypothetical protein
MLAGASISTITYSNRVFAALDGTLPSSTRSGCQSSYLSLPQGWMLAANDATGIGAIRAFPWGTDVMVLGDGTGFKTALYPPAAGQLWGSSNLLQDVSGRYKPSTCSLRILIQLIAQAAGSFTVSSGLCLRLWNVEYSSLKLTTHLCTELVHKRHADSQLHCLCTPCGKVRA